MSSKLVACQVTLTLLYVPEMDTIKDIEDRIRGEINTLLNRGNLSGCEHGAQVKDWDLKIVCGPIPKE